MFKRLFVLLLLVAATVSVNTPARASTLTVNSLSCYLTAVSGSFASFDCQASVSGGTGTYTSFTWGMQSNFYPSWTYLTTTSPTISNVCDSPDYYWVTVTVTDSAGASAGSNTSFSCRTYA